MVSLTVIAKRVASDYGLEVVLQAIGPGLNTTLGLEGTIYNHNDLQRRHQAGKPAEPLSPMAAHVINLDKDKRIDIQKRTLQAGQALANSLVCRLQAKRPNVLRAVFCRLDGRRWTKTSDRKLTEAVSMTNLHIFYVPTLNTKEDGSSIMARTQQAQQYFDRVSPGKKAYPTVHAQHTNFRAVIQQLVNAGYETIALELKGMKGVKQNLEDLRAVLSAAAKPPYLVAFNVPRTEDRTTWAASALVLATFGVQASCQQVMVAFPPKKDAKPRQIKWFHPQNCDYLNKADFPSPLSAVCNCENHAYGATMSGDEFIDQCNHELDGRRLEAKKMAAAIAAGALNPFATAKSALAKGIKALT